jgi:hypothetical protein
MRQQPLLMRIHTINLLLCFFNHDVPFLPVLRPIWPMEGFARR